MIITESSLCRVRNEDSAAIATSTLVNDIVHDFSITTMQGY
jgi:hypothetical protein